MHTAVPPYTQFLVRSSELGNQLTIPRIVYRDGGDQTPLHTIRVVHIDYEPLPYTGMLQLKLQLKDTFMCRSNRPIASAKLNKVVDLVNLAFKKHFPLAPPLMSMQGADRIKVNVGLGKVYTNAVPLLAKPYPEFTDYPTDAPPLKYTVHDASLTKLEIHPPLEPILWYSEQHTEPYVTQSIPDITLLPAVLFFGFEPHVEEIHTFVLNNFSPFSDNAGPTAQLAKSIAHKLNNEGSLGKRYHLNYEVSVEPITQELTLNYLSFNKLRIEAAFLIQGTDNTSQTPDQWMLRFGQFHKNMIVPPIAKILPPVKQPLTLHMFTALSVTASLNPASGKERVVALFEIKKNKSAELLFNPPYRLESPYIAPNIALEIKDASQRTLRGKLQVYIALTP